MKKITTRAGIFGAAGLGAAALVIGGIAAPALAADVDDSGNSSEQSYSGSLDSALQNTLDFLNGDSSVGNGVLLSPSTSADGTTIDGGGLVNAPLVQGPLMSNSLNGDALSGNEVGSGNDIPVVSGNDTPIASGNDVAAPVASGNDVTAPVEAPVDAPVGSGNDTSVDTGDTDVSGGDIGTQVGDLVDGVTGGIGDDLDLGGILGD